MEIDITPSLAKGELQAEMLMYVCRYYSFAGEADEAVQQKYYFIPRIEAPGQQGQLVQPVELVDPNIVYSLFIDKDKTFHQTLYNRTDDVIYHGTKQAPLRYFRVANPVKAGAAGMVYRLSAGERTMAVSSVLSGCGFAVLVLGQELYLIHAGAANTCSSQSDKKKDAKRRLLINRDIYLMANVLMQKSCEPILAEDGQGNSILEGIDRTTLLNLLAAKRFRGFVAVPAAEEERGPGVLWPNTDVQPLYVKPYKAKKVNHDTLCVISERGNMSVGFREMRTAKTVDDCIRYIQFHI